MAILVTLNWGFLLAAGVLGFCMGWIAVVTHARPVSRNLMRVLSGLALMLVGLALARLVSGRFGYWLDLGLVMFAVYLVGCAIGSWLRDRVVSRHVLTHNASSRNLPQT